MQINDSERKTIAKDKEFQHFWKSHENYFTRFMNQTGYWISIIRMQLIKWDIISGLIDKIKKSHLMIKDMGSKQAGISAR